MRLIKIKIVVHLIFTLLLLTVSCQVDRDSQKVDAKMVERNEIVRTDFQSILDSAKVQGSILVLHNNTFYSNDFAWAKKGQLPASTFKIPNSIIALELGIMQDESSINYWDGNQYWLDVWEQDLSFKDAFHFSCVPCYQEIARKVGVSDMILYTSKFDYGKLQIDSTNLDLFWLEGASTINSFEQIDFLKRFNEEQLEISGKTYSTMQRMMIIDETENYTLRGKTGWSIQNEQDNCWFVGYVTTKKATYYFATNVVPSDKTNMEQLTAIRKDVTFSALKTMGISINP